ncbi:hypothetical protein Poli38472_008371 [Pythium oligandrum]|uniref:Protein kinase domain-containing protein n=1 Tax=Pythium oligandrum TaxID=41045 RepID=A0A8K1FLY7_PYTOL|nr:hypothetical protein Poli38472_008371 [Pythium oligandrum]|eukprot:TMW65729.1 hypothetical protein Poli38472_008371 [Pythium oligandrum]
MMWEGIADRYRITGMVSDGTYTTVFKAETCRSNDDCNGDDDEEPLAVAIKLIQPHGFDVLSVTIERDITILEALRHDNIRGGTLRPDLSIAGIMTQRSDLQQRRRWSTSTSSRLNQSLVTGHSMNVGRNRYRSVFRDASGGRSAPVGGSGNWATTVELASGREQAEREQ